MTANHDATTLLIPTVRQSCSIELIDAIRATLATSDLVEPLCERYDAQHTDSGFNDAGTICDESYVLETLWTFKTIESVRIQEDELQWCIAIEDTSLATDWFEQVVCLGRKLSDYAYRSISLGDQKMVVWHRQWVTSDRVPHAARRTYLNLLVSEWEDKGWCW